MSIIVRSPKFSGYYTYFRYAGQAYNRKTGFNRPQKYQGLKSIDPAEKKLVGYKNAVAFEARLRKLLAEERIQEADATKFRHPVLTVNQILEAWQRYAEKAMSAGRLKRSSAKGAENALTRILREMNPGRNVGDLPISSLSRQTILEYQDSRLAAAGDPESQSRIKVSINSDVRKARQVFARRAVDHYAAEGFRMPSEMDGFLAAAHLREPKGGFRGIEAGQLAALDKMMEGISEAQTDIYLAYLLIRCLGMRNGAILEARWEWIETFDGWAAMAIRPRAYYRPKTAYAVPIDPSVLSKLLEARGDAAPLDPIICPSDMTRGEGGRAHTIIYRTLSSLIRPHVHSEATKTSYELRKHAGSAILTQTDSIEAAAAFLGNSPEVCRKNYARYLGILPTISL